MQRELDFDKIKELIEIAISSERDFYLCIKADGEITVNIDVPRKMTTNNTATSDPVVKF